MQTSKIKFSICIPVLNEEKYIGILLDSLVNQTHTDFEVIVVDGQSTDNTLKVIKKYKKLLDLKVIVADKRGVGYQRNLGAQQAKNEYLIFFDADVKLETKFIEKVAHYITNNKVDFVTAWSNPSSKKKVDKVIFFTFNIFYLEAVKRFSPGAVGAFVCVRKKVFEAVKGFDETVKLGEEYDLARRVFLSGYNYALLRDPKIDFSLRRLESEGRPYFIFKNIQGAFRYHIKGPIKDSHWFKHEFGNF